MKKRNKSKDFIKKDIKYNLWFILLLVVTLWITFQIQEINQYSERLEMVLQIPISEKNAYGMQIESRERSESYEFLLWEQKERGIVNAPSLNEKSLEVIVLILCGNSNLLFENTFELDYFDKDICLVDKKTAYDMFGTTEVKGLVLTYEGKQYEIADVIDMDKGLFVYQISGNGEQLLTRISIRDYSQKSLAYLKELFDMSWISGNRLDYELINFFLMTLVIIVFFSSTRFWVSQLRCKVWNDCNGVKKYHVLYYVIIIVFHLMVLINSLYFPKDYLANIVAQEFWTQLIEQKVENFSYFIEVEKSIFEMDYIFYAIRIVMGLIMVLVMMNMKCVIPCKFSQEKHSSVQINPIREADF